MMCFYLKFKRESDDHEKRETLRQSLLDKEHRNQLALREAEYGMRVKEHEHKLAILNAEQQNPQLALVHAQMEIEKYKIDTQKQLYTAAIEKQPGFLKTQPHEVLRCFEIPASTLALEDSATPVLQAINRPAGSSVQPSESASMFDAVH